MPRLKSVPGRGYVVCPTTAAGITGLSGKRPSLQVATEYSGSAGARCRRNRLFDAHRFYDGNVPAHNDCVTGTEARVIRTAKGGTRTRRDGAV